MTTTQIQIRFNDIDIFGHVNNSMYNQYFDMGRMDYVGQILSSANKWQGKTLVLVHIEMDFMSPIFIDDKIEVQTSVYELGTKSIKMFQQLIDKQGNVRAKSRSVLSCFDTVTQKSFELPADWIESINRFEGANQPE